MPEVLSQNLYDFPKYYELVFGSDWAAEFHFLESCFQEDAQGEVSRLLEPACGTGRLLYRFARQGYEVFGIDLNSHAVRYCNARLTRHGFPKAAVEGDMSAFSLRTLKQSRKFDAAFNTINSFRHLDSHARALAHLQCVGQCVRKGGIYVLGLHLTPTVGERTEDEAWSASRGSLTVNSYLWSKGLDLESRRESIGMRFDIYTPTKHQRIEDETVFRTYTVDQMIELIDESRCWAIQQTYDFTYDRGQPIELDGSAEDVVFILKRS